MRIKTDTPLLIGHRGAPSLEVENTIPSYQAALDAGLDGIEIDIHRTRDGVLAVYHDPVTSSGLDLMDTDWKALKQAHPDTPRLEDVFALMEGYSDRYLNIELKSRYPLSDDRETALAKALADWKHNAAERAWISCFDPLALVKLKRLDVQAPRALLVWREDGLDVPDMIPELALAGLHVEQRLATSDRIDRWHAAGWFVCAWTVNSAEAARQLAEAGIDGIIGDYPGRLQEAVA